MLPHLRKCIKTFRKIGVEGRSVPGYSSRLEGNVLCGRLAAYLEKGLCAVIFMDCLTSENKDRAVLLDDSLK
jgi:hypothetical protein